MKKQLKLKFLESKQTCYLKNVESASVATALAKYDFPVPGGPYRRKALHGRLFPKSQQIKFDQQNLINTSNKVRSFIIYL